MTDGVNLGSTVPDLGKHVCLEKNIQCCLMSNHVAEEKSCNESNISI